jgi:SAM-dependent methyltransferase
MLNLGCGRVFNENWRNYDIAAVHSSVIEHDLRNPIPICNDTAFAVYHSHVLEHLDRRKAFELLQECFRVLIPGGIVRIVVPDLEQIARQYIAQLDQAVQGCQGAEDRHEWITIELLDQLTRNFSGGEMRKYWLRCPVPEEGYLVERMGREYLDLLPALNIARKDELESKSQSTLFKDTDAAGVGKFRLSGEPHLWMYDRFSLARLLKKVGFTKIERKTAIHSFIPNFRDYNLDTLPDGTIRKPDSLYMEAVKS